MSKEQPIKSQFKYTIPLGSMAMNATFKVKRTKKDRIVNILLGVFLFLMVGMLAWDITKDRGIVLDVILIVALTLMIIFSITMPFIIRGVHKKFLKKIDIDSMEYTITEITNKYCTETYYKDNGKVALQNACDIRDLIGYQVVDNYIFLVFNNFACAIMDMNTLENTTPEECQIKISQIIQDNKSKYPKGFSGKR